MILGRPHALDATRVRENWFLLLAQHGLMMEGQGRGGQAEIMKSSRQVFEQAGTNGVYEPCWGDKALGKVGGGVEVPGKSLS